MAAIRVEVVYALADGADIAAVRLPAGARVRDALEASGLAKRHPGLDLSQAGIFGERRHADAPLRDGDRVEVYRPLRIDPKESRRRRALKGRKGGRR